MGNRVSGLAGASPFDPPRSKPYPMPPLPVKSSGVVSSARPGSWMAPFSRADGDPVPAAAGTQRLHQLRFLPSVWLRSRRQIEFAGNGHSSGGEDRPLRNPPQFLRPSHRNGCEWPRHRRRLLRRETQHTPAESQSGCSLRDGAETPRLLLLSANKQFPNGLANSSGFVGKNLMLNSGGVTVGVFEHPLNDYKGFAVSRVLHDSTS